MSESQNIELKVAIDRRQLSEWSAIVKELIADGLSANDARREANTRLRRKVEDIPMAPLSVSDDGIDLQELKRIVKHSNARGQLIATTDLKPFEELELARDFARSAKAEFGLILKTFRSGDDPPDVTAKLDGKKIGIEVTRLLDQEFLNKNVKRSSQHISTTRAFIWSANTFETKVNDILDSKGSNYQNRSIEIDILLIHSDELWLNPRDVKDWIGNMSFQRRCSINSAYLTLFRDPTYSKLSPVFRLYD